MFQFFRVTIYHNYYVVTTLTREIRPISCILLLVGAVIILLPQQGSVWRQSQWIILVTLCIHLLYYYIKDGSIVGGICELFTWSMCVAWSTVNTAWSTSGSSPHHQYFLQMVSQHQVQHNPHCRNHCVSGCCQAMHLVSMPRHFSHAQGNTFRQAPNDFSLTPPVQQLVV